ncbi:MAG: hypothetical protein N2053_05975, partial [Chitinispirillaceae bacterium]|nr:hypothetical protein [Chitinispirillaceae bacterium]
GHIIAAKAIALTEANTPAFKEYAHKIVKNASILAEECIKLGMKVATGGTDNHLFLIDVTPFGLTGRQAESALRECGITLNRNSLPYDINGPWYTSGLRLGTPAVTTLGMGKEEMKEIANIIYFVLTNTKPTAVTSGEQKGTLSKAKYVIEKEVIPKAKNRVKELLSKFLLYPEIDLEYLKKEFIHS